MDTDEDFRGERIDVRQVYFNDFEAFGDSSLLAGVAHSGVKAIVTSPKQEFSQTLEIPKTKPFEKADWLRAGAWFYGPQKEWEPWWMPQFVVHLEKNGKIIKNRKIRPFRVMNSGEWKEVWMDIRLPKEGYDRVKIFLWNAGGSKTLFMDDLKLEVYSEQMLQNSFK